MAPARKIVLLDSPAILNDFAFEFRDGIDYFTTNKVFDEFIDVRSKGLVEHGLKAGRLKIADPSTPSLERVRGVMRLFGLNASEADKSIVALAEDFGRDGLNFTVLTDDHSVQRALKALKLPFKGVLHPEIR